MKPINPLIEDNNIDLPSLLGRFYASNASYGACYVGAKKESGSAFVWDVCSPINNKVFAHTAMACEQHLHTAVAASLSCFMDWRNKPAPKRGLLVLEFSKEIENLYEEMIDGQSDQSNSTDEQSNSDQSD